MKAKIGMYVHGTLGNGKIISTSRAFCIYENSQGIEEVEPWENIYVKVSPTEKPISSIEDKDLPEVDSF